MTLAASPGDRLLSRPADKAHMVQLYRDPAVLHHSVAHYLSDGFQRGDAAAVIATSEHWTGFRRELEKRGHDPARIEEEGKLVVRDARSTLDAFMRGGMPDESLFQDTVRPLLSALSSGGAPNVRAYGEMVALLWKDRQFDAAIRLEELWNGLAESHSFMLLCAYEGDALAPEFHGRIAESIYRQHTHVVPAEDYERLSLAVQRAMEEVLGRTETETLRPLIAGSQRRVPVLPGAQTTLLWLQSNLPHLVAPVLSAARRIVQGNGATS